MRLLLVQDQEKLGRGLNHELVKNGYLVETASDEETYLELAASGIYDVIVLDNRTNGKDGISILRELRCQEEDTPVLMLTPDRGSRYCVEGLDAGADDCLATPFSTEELLARLRALTRRRGRKFVGNTISVAGMTLDPLRGEVMIKQRVIHLTIKEASLLELLMLNCGQVVTKERIFEKVWGYCSESDIANVDLYIHYLRKKLRVSSIKTKRGVGYSLREDSQATGMENSY
ncbi:MAG: response regulator transcription factor [Firmicutes bacterium]|nr:response regulator transcription factor [Bacillota bacterium]